MCGQLTPLTHDFHRLLKNVKKLSNNQATILDFDDDVTEFNLEIKPNDGYFRRGKFDFKIETTNYPQEAPKVRCATRIYHPNISEEDNGDVCLSLFDEWTDNNDLEDCVQGLLFLLYNPNLEDPLNPFFDPTDGDQHQSFEEDVKRSLEGAEVEGIHYERNIVEEELNEDFTGLTNEGFNGSTDDGEIEESQQDGTEARPKDDETSPQPHDNTAVKSNELSENDIITTKNESNNNRNDELVVQNARNQTESKETGIS